MDNWKNKLSESFNENNDSWDNVEKCTIPLENLETEFDDGYGSAGGEQFILWTKDRVYFSYEYDGADFVESVQRNP